MQTNPSLSDPHDTLKFIEQAIRETKTEWQEQSSFYLLWGWGISLACLAQYVLIKMNQPEISDYYWPIIIAACILGTIFLAKRKKERTQTHGIDFIGKLWMVLGIALFLMGFIATREHLSPCILSFLIAGIGTLTSGLFTQSKPLIFGGIVLFLGCLACTFVSQVDMLLINAFALIFGYIVPAYLLKKSEA